MAEKDKRYYWLKLKRDFFKRHDIRIVEALPNGKEYILFYLKLLCESVDHDGNLRFSDQIPYNEEMLSTITNTNIDIVRAAIELFSQLNMIEVLDDGTYFMNQVQGMIGSETYWAEQKRKQREQEKVLMLDNVQQESNSSPTCPSKSKRQSKSKSNSKNNISDSVLEKEFEQLWAIYPNKKGSKKKALEAYKRARKKGTTFADVEIGINDYCLYIKIYKIKSQYVKHGSTFFNQQAWEADWLPDNVEFVEEDELDGIL